MHEQGPVALVCRVYQEILNEGDLDLADAVIAVDAVDHAPTPLSSLPIHGPESLKGFVQEFCCAFPDASWEIERIAAFDTLVTVRTVVTGTQLDAFQGVAATGAEMRMTTTDTLRIVAGKIVEHWGTLPPLEPRTVAVGEGGASAEGVMQTDPYYTNEDPSGVITRRYQLTDDRGERWNVEVYGGAAFYHWIVTGETHPDIVASPQEPYETSDQAFHAAIASLRGRTWRQRGGD